MLAPTQGRMCMPEGTLLDPESLRNFCQPIWSFPKGEAETVFQNANSLKDLEAWRRIIKYIDHGEEIKLERMRTEMKSIHSRHS